MSALLIALALQQAVAPNWERAGTAPGLTGYYDPASVVVVDGNRRRLRILAVYDQEKENGVTNSIALVELDCASQSGTMLEMGHLDRAGNVIGSHVVPPAERRAEPLPPGSAEAVIFTRVCGRPAR